MTRRFIATFLRGKQTMKFTVDVDCTPEEARAFLGLPDVAPMQQALMQEVEDRMRANLKAMDPEALFKAWLPTGVPGGMEVMEQMQKAFFSQFGAGAPKKGGKE